MRAAVLFLLAALSTAPALASEAGAALAARALDFELRCCTPPAGWHTLDAAALDNSRGGFEMPSGLSMSLGIERLVSINGQLVSQTGFSIANLGSMTADEARQARDAIGSARLVQNGAGNFTTAGGPGTAGTYIQNTLSGQTIGAQTIISASVNSASLLKDINFNSGVRDAGLRAIPNH